jgi:hypothetical protein
LERCEVVAEIEMVGAESVLGQRLGLAFGIGLQMV